MNAVILGDRSDIMQEMIPLMERDGWNVYGWHRGQKRFCYPWDLVIVAIGSVAPVGSWHSIDDGLWELAIESNMLLPVRLLRSMWRLAAPNASVCFMAGANPNKPMKKYSAYSVGKMALLKACEHLDLESSDCKFFALAPGVVLTKIHRATDEAGIRNERLERARRDGGVPMARIYSCLRWCIRQEKSVVGGRNICVSDSEDWDIETHLQEKLLANPSMFKLRRQA